MDQRTLNAIDTLSLKLLDAVETKRQEFAHVAQSDDDNERDILRAEIAHVIANEIEQDRLRIEPLPH